MTTYEQEPRQRTALELEIGHLTFIRFPTRGARFTRTVRVNDMIFAVQHEKVVACSRDLTSFQFRPSAYRLPFLETVLTGLQRLGLISKAAMAEYLADVEQGRADRDRRDAADHLAEAAKQLGIALTQRQVAAIARAKANPERVA